MPSGRPPDEIKTDQYAKAFDWLHNFLLSTQWEALQKAKALLPERVWKNYKASGITGFREQRILEEAQLAVRKRWKQNRPSFFGRVYKAKDESPDSESES